MRADDAGVGMRAAGGTERGAPARTGGRGHSSAPRRGRAQPLSWQGDAVGLYEAALHAKVTGYLLCRSAWIKAIGSRRARCWPRFRCPNCIPIWPRPRPNLAIARITYERLRRVQQTDPRLISQQDVDMAYAKYQESPGRGPERCRPCATTPRLSRHSTA